MASYNLVGSVVASEGAHVHIGDNITYRVGREEIRQAAFHGRAFCSRLPSINIPYTLDDELYVERRDLLARTWDLLARDGSRAALCGLGGVGKSQIAIRYASQIYENHKRMPGLDPISVYWIHANTQERVEDGFEAIAYDLKIPNFDDESEEQERITGEKMMSRVSQRLASSQTGRWLIVLDSADNEDVFWGEGDNATQDTANRTYKYKDGMASYFPNSPNGSILITTRDKNIGQRFAGDREVISVNPMPSNLALELLKMRMRHPLNKSLPYGEELVRKLANIPLAISQAAACLYSNGWTIRQYCGYLNSVRRWELLEHRAYEPQRDPRAENAIAKTWIISFEQIRSQRESACDLLAVMSFLYSKNLPGFLLKAWSRQISFSYGEDTEISEDEEMAGNEIESRSDRFDDDVKLLKDFGMISINQSRHVSGNIFEMHDLVQRCIKKWLKSTEEIGRFPVSFYEEVAGKIMGEEADDIEQWDKIVEIQEKLEQYNDAILKQAQIARLRPPVSYDRDFFRLWLMRPDMGDFPMKGLDQECYTDKHEGDLVALTSRPAPDTSIAPIEDGLDQGVYRYENSILAATVRIVTTVLASLFPVCSVTALYFIESNVVRLAFVIVASGFFALALALMTNARMIEVFAATSAYAAVNVVFLTNVVYPTDH
ncbi:P-loop containing nucleoside triphosphate hydrolase protein [Xylariaceae sp. FL1272]|nr:P-loop containing nucleoside triphosphate hydrolase protein [Xylariaceae sp. FL1272]